MISNIKFFNILKENEIDFFVGVPDSAIKNFISFITDKVDSNNHIITANEGTAISTAIGYQIANQKIPIIYMQNSGLGNAINPITSLVDEKVYKIPMILLIGWRGEPGFKDEPQHIKQGEITLSQLDLLGIDYEIIGEDEVTALEALCNIIESTKSSGKIHALVVKKNVFEKYDYSKNIVSNSNLSRENALFEVMSYLSEDDIIVSTTGKLSRELFEYRENLNQAHHGDFLTVGGMGHASSIALGIALAKPKTNVYCFDGDGAAIMHLGAFTNLGQSGCNNIKHIIFNNGAHESVGGQKTYGFEISFTEIANSCGYSKTFYADDKDNLSTLFSQFQNCKGPAFLEIRVGIDTRSDLGRPTTSPLENKIELINKLNEKD